MVHALFSASQFHERCDTWQEAVKLACLPLEEQGVITTEYAQAIIRETEQHGPWYILSPRVCHYRMPAPEEGVASTRTHLSLLSLKDAVHFQDHPEMLRAW